MNLTPERIRQLGTVLVEMVATNLEQNLAQEEHSVHRDGLGIDIPGAELIERLRARAKELREPNAATDAALEFDFTDQATPDPNVVRFLRTHLERQARYAEFLAAHLNPKATYSPNRAELSELAESLGLLPGTGMPIGIARASRPLMPPP